MAHVKAANVTKYDNGGSGDNYIADGYIKSVEKVWIDSYAIGTTTIASTDTIKIGRIPKNKKITDIIVDLPVLMAGTTVATILVGSASTMTVAANTCYLGALHAASRAFGTNTVDVATVSTVSLTGEKRFTVTDKDVDLYLKIILTGGTSTDTTGGTIRTIIKYT